MILVVDVYHIEDKGIIAGILFSDWNAAKEEIKKMYGENRFPTLLKKVD